MWPAFKHDRDYSSNTIVLQAAGLITFVKTEDEEALLATLGGRVKWARQKRKLTQAALGKLATVSQSTIGNIEAGIRTKPRELLAIAAALEVSPRWLDARKGDWDASISSQRDATTEDPRGSHIHELTDDEWAMLTNYRRLLDKDRKHFDGEISKAADERQQEMDELFARYGVAKAAERANARRSLPHTEIDPADPRLQQQGLFDKGEK